MQENERQHSVEYKKRNAGLAAIINVFCPGIGSMYAGYLRRGIVIGVAINLLVPVIGLIALGTSYSIFVGIPVVLVLALDGVLIARRANNAELKSADYHRWYFYLLFVFGFIIVNSIATTIAREYLVRAFKIPTHSMAPALVPGDHIVIKKFNLDIRRGDMVVFDHPRDPEKSYVKRVVGLPGDRLHVGERSLKNNSVEFAAEPVGEYSYTEQQMNRTVKTAMFSETVQGREYSVLYEIGGVGSFTNEELMGDVTVPEGKYYVMGDNRDRSNDSRYFGFINEDAIEGVVANYYWPPSRFGDSMYGE